MNSRHRMKPRSLAAVVLVLAQLWLASGAWAVLPGYEQPPKDTPFTLTGFIQSATLADPTSVLSGGTVTVNGISVTIPTNAIVLMPGTFLSWQELWSNAPLPWGLASNGGNGLTGLAITDVDPATGKKPLATYEITINGNCIPGLAGVDPLKCTYVAGLVAISQQSLNVGQGVINFIDYAAGELHIGGALNVNSSADTRIQINDPILPGLGTGRYSKGLSPDPRFATDQGNPAIRAKTGYPMCIPRTDPAATDDPECPQKNRPEDPNSALTPKAPLGNFTLGPPGTTVVANATPAGITPVVLATAIQTGDSTKQAPLKVGDYIEYSGTLQQDATGPYISAHQIVSNVGIYTSPGTNPAYLAMEVTLLGVAGQPITFPNAVPQEATGRIKAVGFFTDPTRTVDLFAVDVDPCTGAETERSLLPSISGKVVPWGRFRDIDKTCPTTGVGCGAPTREWRARYTGTTDVPAANGLQTLQYTIPVAEYIFPENTVYGDPTLLAVPMNFQDFPFLVNGSGPWRGTGPVVGQLTPFPLTNSIPGLTPQVTGPASCTGQLKPTANAGANQTVISDAKVTLTGTGSDPNVPAALPLTFQWIQTSGPAVALSNPGPTSINASPATDTTAFTAPHVAQGALPVTLTFDLTVTNAYGLSSTATTAVTVTPPPPPPADSVTITGAVYRTGKANLSVTATSSSSTSTCAAILTLTTDTGLTANMTCTPGTGGALATYTYNNRPVNPRPSTVTVKSSLGGTATSAVTIRP